MSMTHDEMIAVIAHHKNGGKVQADNAYRKSGWIDVDAPTWNFHGNIYRAKPEPLVLWAAYYPDGGLYAVRTTESALRLFLGDDAATTTIKKFVEVTE